jgi:hypothetical protein
MQISRYQVLVCQGKGMELRHFCHVVFIWKVKVGELKLFTRNIFCQPGNFKSQSEALFAACHHPSKFKI